ncbi:probable arabinosyltransferase ARAD1 [Tanacetum coccineum]
MSEKRVFFGLGLPFVLVAVSVFFLILSCSLLFRAGDSSLVPRSIYNLIVVDSGSVEPKSSSCKEFCSESEPEPVKRAASCDPSRAVLKVFMYDLPSEFHFGLLGWKGNPNQIWPKVGNFSEVPRYPGGLNLQHSIEYWLTLDLLSSLTPNVARACSAVLVHNSSQADVVFVPFFSSLSYNRHSKIEGDETKSTNDILQERLVEYLNSRDEWKRSGGKDHVIMAHHPNSMLIARWKLGSAMFILADFGRYLDQIANVDKDVIAPYKHVVRSIDPKNSPPFEERPTLVYFQGAIYRKDGGVIRQELYYLMKDEEDVHFTFGSAVGGGIRKASTGMTASKFCLNIAGDTPSSNRLFDAIVSHCVPVIISDEIELPYEDALDYSQFSIFVRSSDACKDGYLLKLLRGIKKEKWTEMWENLKIVCTSILIAISPSTPGDAVDMIWKAVSRKVSTINYKAHRRNRYNMSKKFLNVH